MVPSIAVLLFAYWKTYNLIIFQFIFESIAIIEVCGIIIAGKNYNSKRCGNIQSRLVYEKWFELSKTKDMAVEITLGDACF